MSEHDEDMLERIVAAHVAAPTTPAEHAIVDQTVAAVRNFAGITGVDLTRETVLTALWGSMLHQAVMIELGVNVDELPADPMKAIRTIGWVQVALSKIAGARP